MTKDFLATREFNPDAAETIVFLHSSNTAGWMWGEQVPAFDDHHLLVPDLPGYGDNNDLEWLSLADSADHVAKLIERRGAGGTAHVVGLSLGSSVALELARRHPERVSTLFLASANIAKPGRALVWGGRALLTLWNSPGYWKATGRSYGLAGEDLDLFVSTGAGIRKQTAQRVLAEVTRGVSPDALTAVSAPVIAIAGGKDAAFISRDSLRLLAEVLPDARTAIAPGLHHQWNIEDVPLFNAAVREWLTSRSLAGGLEPGPVGAAAGR